MGFVKQAKNEMVAKDAADARDAGHTVLAIRLNMPTFASAVSGRLDTWTQMIGAVEAEGWTLTHWAACLDKNGKPEAYPLFQRTLS